MDTEPKSIELPGLEVVLDRLSDDGEQTRHLNLLDSQWFVFLQQLWVQTERR